MNMSFSKGNSTIDISKIRLAVLYDNKISGDDLQCDWGFSCLIEGAEKTILFDTGTKGSILMDNFKKMNLSPEIVDAVVLSHDHFDHTGGLEDFLKENNDVDIYIPSSFPYVYDELANKYRSKIVRIADFSPICDGIYSTGEMGAEIIEQSLIINGNEKIVIITGCAHPGIVDICEKAKEETGKEILYVIGGFHLFRSSGTQIVDVISRLNELGIEKISACHCTGDEGLELFEKHFGKNYTAIGAGKIINISELR